MSVRKTRNDSDFWYCMYNPSVQHAIVDEYGNETGEVIPDYVSASSFWANVSPAAGAAQFEAFGNMGNYDKVIVTRDMECPIDENTVLFIDKEPEYKEIITHELVEGNALYADPSVSVATYDQPMYDYVVKNVARGLDAIAIAVTKVNVG